MSYTLSASTNPVHLQNIFHHCCGVVASEIIDNKTVCSTASYDTQQQNQISTS